MKPTNPIINLTGFPFSFSGIRDGIVKWIKDHPVAIKFKTDRQKAVKRIRTLDNYDKAYWTDKRIEDKQEF